MEHYEEMYYRLFNKITDIIYELQTVQAETEELFLLQGEEQKVFRLFAGHKEAE